MTKLKHYSIKELADYIACSYEGDGDFIIEGLSSLTSANVSDLVFYVSKRYKTQLLGSKAGCVLISPKDKDQFSGNKLLVDDPYLSFAKLSILFSNQEKELASIHSSALIADDVVIDDSVTVGPNVVIESGCYIGAESSIGANCYIGKDSRLGAKTLLYPNVTLYNDVYIGEACVLHSGSVVGADGFGFAPSKEGWQKIYQLGGVRIGDAVEVGANTTIDRGALDNTVIADGVKIDNLVQIAHNVIIGKNTAIAAATAIAGSTVIGERCTIAGCAGIVGHINITDDVHITGMTMVSKSISKAGSYSSGVPMNETVQWKKNAVRFNQLDSMARKLKLKSK